MRTEAQIEKSLIEKLVDLKYVYRDDIKDRMALEVNFREHFQRLNKVHLSDAEFSRLKESIITPNVFAAAKTLRETNTFKRDDDTPLQYTIVNTEDWGKNHFEVVNQLRINTENSNHRYDVILLINGIPVVQIELKALQVSPRRAMEQIVEYKNDSGNGYTNSLLCFMQIFVVSNESNTYYFANNDKEHFCFNADERFLPVYQLADENNRKISHLHDFADAFLRKSTLSQLISKYMVLIASEKKLMIMRPYQIYAVRAIMDCIEQNRGNGYIWHTTGSGKTLTSFKASTLLKDNENIAKCLFVVDRKDLDRQTREEFNRFQEGCVEENTNTEKLVKRLLSEDYRDKVIVTTIQKLGLALDDDSKRNQAKKKRGELTYKERLTPLRNKRIVVIFDECHRSQFGENHKAIKEFFPKAQLFGFTGTPIFEENATYKQIDGTIGSYTTTKDIFEKELHAYTITHAIDDKNVLRFHIDYFKPDTDKKIVKPSDTMSKRAIVETILSKHDIVTSGRRFNAILATSSINHAIEYYDLFHSLQDEYAKRFEDYIPLNIACVFSPPAEGNKDIQQIQEDLPQEKLDNAIEPEKKKRALIKIIDDYNQKYGSGHSIGEFDVYYQDIQKRIKDQQYSNADYPHRNKIDITIVVDMLLTGFDSKFLNTLYVDKKLKYHGLIQAFSRTNRVLNGSKPYGNILDFRGQEKEVDEAIALFSGEKDSARAKEIWLVDPAPKVIDQFGEAVDALKKFMSSQGLTCLPKEVANLKGDMARCEFCRKFKEVQRVRTQLEQYTELKEDEAAQIEKLLPKDTLRAFRGAYIDTAQRLKEQRERNKEREQEIDDMDFEFVLFSSAIIDYDYIMALISQYTQSEPRKQKMNRRQLVDLLSSTSNLMEERDDIIAYIETLKTGEGLNEQEIKNGYQSFKAEKNAKWILSIAEKHGLEMQALNAFIGEIMDRMIFDGEKLSDLLAPLELGWKARTRKELELMEDLIPLLKNLANGHEIMGLNAYES